MSAYIVDKVTIDRIVSLVVDGKELVKYDITPLPVLDEELRAFGQKLWDMNTSAVNQRYDESTPAPVYMLAGAICNKFQMLKSLRCFLYQCSEGDVPQMELYRQLRAVEKSIALDIVCAMPEYERAERC